MNTSPSPFRAHSDVLDAPIPDSDSSKAALLEELKRRAKGAIQAGQWPDARALYDKATHCATSDDDDKAQQQQLAILNANLALCCGKLSEWKESCHYAQTAVELDATYTKGYWRLGQARAQLEEFPAAVRAMQRAMELEPNNKALPKELQSLQQKQQAYLEKKEQEKKKKEQQDETTTTRVELKSDNKDTQSTTTTNNNNNNNAEPMEIDGDTTFTKSEHVKGYKVVNGKKTSYFHNELTEEAKALIGDIRPQKLDNPNAATTTTTTTVATDDKAPNNKDASAWNKAGTWEERDVTTWATQTLQQTLLQQATFTLPASSPAPGATITTTKATVTGHASVATVRGKKRYIYELVVKLEWEFKDDDNDATGTLDFPDVDGTCEPGEYEAVNFVVQHASDDAGLTPLLQRWVHQQGWRDAVHAALDAWVERFQREY